MNILLVPNDPLSVYSDLDRWYDRPRGYEERGHQTFIYLVGETPLEMMDRAISDNDIDVVRTLEGGRWVISYYATIACSKSGVSLIPSVHGELEEISRIRHYSDEELFGMRRLRAISQDYASNLLLVQKSWIRYFAQTKYSSKAIFHPNYVILDQFNTYNRPENRVLYVGRLDQDKDITTVLEVADQVVKNTDVEFLFIGKGSMESEVTRRGHKLISGVAHTEIPELMASSKVVFCAYNGTSGFGMPVMEAQSARRPVVLCRKGWSQEFIDTYIPREDVGYFMNPDYAVTTTKDAVDKITILLEDSNEWKRVSREGRQRMEKNFDRDMILDKEVEVMEEVIANG